MSDTNETTPGAIGFLEKHGDKHYLLGALWPFGDSEPIDCGFEEGIIWAIMMGPRGVNGYACIPLEGHPWVTSDCYDDIEVSVHGGLTYGHKQEYWLPPQYDDESRKAVEETLKMEM